MSEIPTTELFGNVATTFTLFEFCINEMVRISKPFKIFLILIISLSDFYNNFIINLQCEFSIFKLIVKVGLLSPIHLQP